MNKLTYKLWNFFKLPLICCSGCMLKGCEHRLPYFQAPCISWRKFSDWTPPEIVVSQPTDLKINYEILEKSLKEFFDND